MLNIRISFCTQRLVVSKGPINRFFWSFFFSATQILALLASLNSVLSNQHVCWAHLVCFSLFRVQCFTSYYECLKTFISYILYRFLVVYGGEQLQILILIHGPEVQISCFLTFLIFSISLYPPFNSVSAPPSNLLFDSFTEFLISCLEILLASSDQLGYFYSLLFVHMKIF